MERLGGVVSSRPVRHRMPQHTQEGRVEQAFDVIIIGAGQAGLVTARELVRRGLVPGVDLLVLDSNETPGGAWQHRWDSLTMNKAHHIEDLPGLKRASVAEGERVSDVMPAYFNEYEQTFELGVVRPVTVEDVQPGFDNILVVHARLGSETLELRTRCVVSATGTWGSPFVPWVPGLSDFKGTQLHTVDFCHSDDFVGKRTLVVGGGLSAVQMLLELSKVTETIWSTRRPPQFREDEFGGDWGREVEEKMRQRALRGEPLGSVVSVTGIPSTPEYLKAVDEGILVSRGPLGRFTKDAVVFKGDARTYTDLAVPDSWDPFPHGHEETIDVIFWNTGFRAATKHLSGLHLRSSNGGIKMRTEVAVAGDPRVFLVGYGSSASTVGARRAGRAAAVEVMDFLGENGKRGRRGAP